MYFLDNIIEKSDNIINMKMLLDFLVTSETKKKLLNVLWHEGAEASARQLAHLTGCSYATVYEELEQMFEENLVLKTKNGKANLYSANLESQFAKQLSQLVGGFKRQIDLDQLKEQEVEAHLFKYGAPLGGTRPTKMKLSFEETFVAGLILARKNSTVARVLPVVLAKNAKNTDFKKLHFLAQKKEVTRELGFFFDLTGVLSGSRKFKDLARTLKDRRVKRSEPFFVGSSKGKYTRHLEEQNTPHIAKKWHFSMNVGLDSFSSLFEKAMGVQ